MKLVQENVSSSRSSSFSSIWKQFRGNNVVASVEEGMSRTTRDEDFDKRCRTDEVCTSSWNGKLNQPLKEKIRLRKDYLKLSLIWSAKNGSEDVLKWPYLSLIEPTPLTGYEPKTCNDSSSEDTPINCPLSRNSFNTDYNDLITTVAASETTDKEVGQSTSPLFHEREASSNPFCVSGFQQQAAASGSQQQASSSVISPWPSAALWGTRKETEISKVSRFCPKRESFMSILRRKLNEL